MAPNTGWVLRVQAMGSAGMGGCSCTTEEA